LPRARQAPFWRRSAACQGLPEAVPARAHEAVLRARHWARPAALVRLAQGLPRAARGAPGLRQGAEHAAAGRPAAPGAAEERRRAGRQAWARPGVARGAGVPRPVARGVRREARGVRREARQARDVARRRAVRDVVVRPSAAVSVFRQDRVRLVELVQRQSERFARATACWRSAAPSTSLRQAARDESVSYGVSPRKGSEQCKESSLAEGFGVTINSQSLGRIVAGDKTQMLFISFAQQLKCAIIHDAFIRMNLMKILRRALRHYVGRGIGSGRARRPAHRQLFRHSARQFLRPR
jgi:hypothetical protein